MGLFSALIASLIKNKKWILAGIALYIAPVLYRFLAKSSVVPILNSTLFLFHQNSQITPVNLETLGLTFLIPSVVGALVGVSFLEHVFDRRFTGFEKYLARVFGSVSLAFLWVAVHFIGSSFFNPVAPWGGQLFAGSNFYARNLLIALVAAPLVTYVIELLYNRIRQRTI